MRNEGTTLQRILQIKGGEAIATGACSLISATLLTISSMKIGPFHGRNGKITISSMKPGHFRGRDGI